MSCNRGDIFYISQGSDRFSGHVIWSGRPAIIVSNDTLNYMSDVLEVVFLTTRPKRDTPEHTHIMCNGKDSYAICEQICTVDKSRLGDRIGHVTADELEELNKCIARSVGINPEYYNEDDDEPEPKKDSSKISKMDILKMLIENME